MRERERETRGVRPLELPGNVRIGPPLVLAPLAGHTDRAFRALVRRLGGCGLVVTEMVSSEGLTRGSQFSREIAAVTKDERPVGVQIFGSDPERMGEAATLVEDIGADLVDVNMGCPVPKVTRTGSGAALMRDTRQAGRIIERMVSRTGVPVTVKIRSGWDPSSINAPELARVLEAAGASAITVHPRCRSERHRGRSAWPVIASVKRAVRIPVIGNGDVGSEPSARAMFEATGVDGIMIGRGALTHPWVFREIANGLGGKKIPGPALADYQRLFADFIEDLRQYLPDKIVLNRVKAFIGWVTKGLPRGHALRKDVYAAKTLSEALGRFEAYFEAEEDRSANGQGGEDERERTALSSKLKSDTPQITL